MNVGRKNFRNRIGLAAEIDSADDSQNNYTNQLDNVDRFALLILSEDHGAIVREAAPPKR